MSEEASSSPSILCSDAERSHAVDVLRVAVVDGRITLEEFSERIDSAQAARTQGDLASLLGDLPQTSAALTAGDRDEGRTVLFSRLVRSGPGVLARSSRFRCLWGTIDLDLAQARLAGSEVVIEVLNLFGTVSITVPDGVAVQVEGGGLWANQLIERPPKPPPPHAPVLQIRASGPGGTLYVRYATGRRGAHRGRYL